MDVSHGKTVNKKNLNLPKKSQGKTKNVLSYNLFQPQPCLNQLTH